MNKKIIKITLLMILIVVGITEFRIMIVNSIKTNGSFLNKLTDNTELVWNGPRDKKVIALTFDDGPHPRITPKILDLLKKYDVKATFFVLGKHVQFYPEPLKRIKEEGHEIGNHTFSHIDVKNTSEKKIQEEFEKTQDEVFSVIGEKPTVFRPPFGYYNKAVKKVAKKYGVKIILWSTSQDTKDWSNPGVEKIVRTVLNNICNGDIILLHDYVEGRSQTYEALKVILPELKERGYKFVTISQLIDMNNNENIKLEMVED
ncbi:polysaccharide deacetylase family protein [Tepidibacter formicigenes]|uniref:Polysaccharide deacetylase family sporulation protein PdaB n=1 Tax=Tepidibacter formicigenes DSM 15518 TaxID=1123349 RepID=A0A1M6MBB7_9FIRM|nr:polysaccharide deacetylase family protein [Tepidibacter formicigenes]SHJ80751.1 polysaccharide deacetylase family sporulation protein PdaB [Tepidibacter formicigenes DSM 15518]